MWTADCELMVGWRSKLANWLTVQDPFVDKVAWVFFFRAMFMRRSTLKLVLPIVGWRTH